ncbi:MAG TPA: hypothetical protein VIG76_06745 [Amnibacterium sp.]|uniref:hypothetical protein n=1 Tax=Amnibacterium sp. TaxID=1872496 RepID=UPI002F91FA86
MRRRRRLLPLAFVAVAVAALAGCAPTPAPAPTSTTRSASPTTGTVQVQRPGRSVTVLDSPDAVTRALGASRTLFAASPGAVVTRAGSAAGVRAAAAAAGRLRVPLLLVPSDAGTSLDAVRGELARLSATWVAPVGRVPAIPGVHRVDPATQAPPAHAGAASPAIAVVDDEAADAAGVATARAAGADVVPVTTCDLTRSPAAVSALADHADAPAVLLGAGFATAPSAAWTVAAARTGFQLPGGGQRPLPGHRFVALYGVPGVPTLGALGDQGPAASIRRVKALAKQYEPLSDEPVVPTLEIIATVAAGAPGPDRDYSNESDPASLKPWVDAALQAGVEVVLDLQSGRSDFLAQAKQYASLLAQPNVGLALDPEWRLGPHQVPLEQIGRVSAAEVNGTSAWLADLVTARHLPPKPFVLHEFRLTMLQDRVKILDRPQLTTFIHVDGQGGQPDKQATWRAVRNGAPSFVGWGWKNFLHKDHPMLTPAQTMHDVHPAPDLITYQ